MTYRQELQIVTALESYAKEERERCAGIADRAALQYNAAWVAEPIAARIREGGEE